MKPQAAVYCRVSTEEQARTGLSLGIQEDTCRRAAEADGYEVAECYIDDGYSGRSSKRPAYKAMLAALHDYRAVYILRLDRLSRSVRDLFNVLADFSESDTILRTVHGSTDLSSAMGRAMVGVSAVFGALEAELTQERVEEAMDNIVAQGRKLGFAPYGYTQPGPRQIIVPDPKTAPVVREIFHLYATGTPLVELCREMQRQGHLSPTGNTNWGINTIRTMLSRETYIGKILHSRHGTVTDGLHEPIVDRAVWDIVQTRLADNQAVPPRARYGSLSPIFICGYCGATLNIMLGSGKRAYGANRSYYCNRRRVTPQEDRHPPLFLRQTRAEAYAWLMVDWLMSEEAELAYAAIKPKSVAPVKLRRLQDERAELEETIRYNLRAAREASLPMRLVAAENAAATERLAVVEEEIKSLSTTSSAHAGQSARQTLESIKSAGYEQQRVFLLRLFKRITVYRETMVFTLNAPVPLQLTIRKPAKATKATKVELDFVED